MFRVPTALRLGSRATSPHSLHSVQIQLPRGAERWFDAVVTPRHDFRDTAPPANVVLTRVRERSFGRPTTLYLTHLPRVARWCATAGLGHRAKPRRGVAHLCPERRRPPGRPRAPRPLRCPARDRRCARRLPRVRNRLRLHVTALPARGANVPAAAAAAHGWPPLTRTPNAAGESVRGRPPRGGGGGALHGRGCVRRKPRRHGHCRQSAAPGRAAHLRQSAPALYGGGGGAGGVRRQHVDGDGGVRDRQAGVRGRLLAPGLCGGGPLCSAPAVRQGPRQQAGLEPGAAGGGAGSGVGARCEPQPHCAFCHTHTLTLSSSPDASAGGRDEGLAGQVAAALEEAWAGHRRPSGPLDDLAAVASTVRALCEG